MVNLVKLVIYPNSTNTYLVISNISLATQYSYNGSLINDTNLFISVGCWL